MSRGALAAFGKRSANERDRFDGVQDWVSIPYRRSYTIFPSHFTTPLPANVLDSDLSNGLLLIRGPAEPTPVSKLIVLFKTAACVRRFFEDMNSTAGLSYDLCLQIDGQIREIVRQAPKYLQSEAEVDSLPPYVAWMRHYFVLSVSEAFTASPAMAAITCADSPRTRAARFRL